MLAHSLEGEIASGRHKTDAQWNRRVTSPPSHGKRVRHPVLIRPVEAYPVTRRVPEVDWEGAVRGTDKCTTFWLQHPGDFVDVALLVGVLAFPAGSDAFAKMLDNTEAQHHVEGFIGKRKLCAVGDEQALWDVVLRPLACALPRVNAIRVDRG